MSAPIIHIIAGPTASGKSAIALEIAQKTGGVIINADSQQLYKDLRILTARPTPAEESRVPHKLYGILEAKEQSSAGSWLRLAQMEIDWARAQGATPIVVGGTGLYLKALMHGIAHMPPITPETRAQSVNDYEVMGKDAFIERLRAVDPGFFERLKVYDKQRLIRAYEVWLGSGKPLSWWQGRAITPPYEPGEWRLQTVMPQREILYQRCNDRVIQMVELGAVEEVRALLDQHVPHDAPIMKSIGVREFSAFIRQKIDINQAIEQTQQATRNYAKRQMTWIRGQCA